MRKVIVDSLSVVYKYTCVQTGMGWVEIMLFLVLSLLDLEPKKEWKKEEEKTSSS